MLEWADFPQCASEENNRPAGGHCDICRKMAMYRVEIGGRRVCEDCTAAARRAEIRDNERQAARAWLRGKGGATFDAMQAAGSYRQETGERLDWHTFSDVLEELAQAGGAVVVKPGGFIVYRVEC